MTGRLKAMLSHLERLPAETQEEVMAYLEVLIEALPSGCFSTIILIGCMVYLPFRKTRCSSTPLPVALIIA